MADIVVIGSANMDFTVTTPRLPRPGETVMGHRLYQVCGGKGANQAVACGRLGARVAMVGKVGEDPAGRAILAALQADGVAAEHLSVDPGVGSGTAHISVDDQGENCIVVVPGANAQLLPADIDRARPLIAGAKLVLLQLEIPLETVAHALKVAAACGVAVMLDPAPAPQGALPPEFYRLSTWLTPNENEGGALCGFAIDGVAAAERAAILLQERGVRMPVVKLGGAGMVYLDAGQPRHLPAFAVTVVDTTAAGDAFAAGLAVGLSEGCSVAEALRMGAATGALTTTRYGAQPALPTRAEVEGLLTRGTIT